MSSEGRYEPDPYPRAALRDRDPNAPAADQARGARMRDEVRLLDVDEAPPVGAEEPQEGHGRRDSQKSRPDRHRERPGVFRVREHRLGLIVAHRSADDLAD